MHVGSATRVTNCEIGDDLSGQLHRRPCERIRDNLEANFLYLKDDKESVLLVGLDLAGLFEWSYVREVTTAVEARTGVSARSVIITSTHTHDGPDTLGLLHDAPRNDAYLARLRTWILEGAEEAVRGARPARLGWGLGHAHVGYNRRICWADGSHTMYGDCRKPGFTGLEGPDDPAHAVLVAADEKGSPIAIVHNNCCHATCIEGALTVSADFPGEVRRVLRETLGSSLPVLYLQGASGDTSPWNLLQNPAHYDGEQRLKEIGAILAGETLRLVRGATLTADPVFRHAYEDLTIGVRLPSAEDVKRAKAVKAQGEEQAGRGNYVLQVAGALRLHREFKDNPRDTLAVHAIRIGDLGIVTNPCELYCQFGLDIKRRSPAGVTMVAELADGFSGYCPTAYALIGGGYSGDPMFWCRLESAAGNRIADASARLLYRLWE